MSHSLHLWREWREHRFALLVLAALLPLATGLLSLTLSSATVAAPYFALAVGLGACIVFLVAVGGELLGLDRRGVGVRWLERLPSGLAGAFRAKLVFFALALAVTLVYGFGSGWLCGVLRSVHAARDRNIAELLGARRLMFCLVLCVALGAWTFAVSAWTLRGGLALLAAALVLALLGLPVWRVVEGGYLPHYASEAFVLAVLLLPSALLAAWLGFVRGARLGHGQGFAALLGLSPAAVVWLVLAGWSASKLAERDAFDPRADDLDAIATRIAGDGRTAFLFGRRELPGWNRELMPVHAVRVDLEHGSCEELGRLEREFDRFRFTSAGLSELDEFVIALEERQPLVFGAAHGEPRAFDAERKALDDWRAAGLGLMHVLVPRVVRDPFRGRDFSLSELGDVAISGTLLVRPGRWLYAPSPVRWSWLDPETMEQTPVDWPDGSKPLVLFEDGRILLAEPGLGVRTIDPEHGTSLTLDTRGLVPEEILPNPGCGRVPGGRYGAVPPGTIVLRARQAFLVLGEDATEARRVDVPDDVRFGRLVDRDTAIVTSTEPGGGLSRLDLVSGALTGLWPRD